MVTPIEQTADSTQFLLKVGDVLNQKWVILEFIDKGGMGEVYRAHQTNLNRDVAIKIISREWLESIANGDQDAEMFIHRFKREVQAMAQIRHSNVLQVYDNDSVNLKINGADKPVEYIAMEYIPGGSLRDTMSEEGFYPEIDSIRDWIRDFYLPTLKGVDALHNAGIVHRDLKPENILLDHGKPKIADFGLSRSHSLKPITQSIDVKGSPHYMSPEHFFDFKRADHKSDVYSLGKILFEAIDGKIEKPTTPFKSVNLNKTESPFFLKLDHIISNATQENRDKRTESVKILQEEVSALLKNKSKPKQRTQEHKTFPRRIFSISNLVWGGIVTGVLSLIMILSMYFFGGSIFSSDILNSEPALKTTDSSNQAISKNIQKSVELEHIGKQRLISGGKLVLPTTIEESAGKKVKIESFYMDEFLVTNQQFVDFLNHNLSRIKLESGVVKGDGANWYLLGEVNEGYDPIIFRNNEFHVSDPSFSSSPVLRVTGYGATAFATFFNRRLPTEAEWLYVTLKGAPAKSINKRDSSNQTMNMGTMMNSMMNNMMNNDSGNENWNMDENYQSQTNNTNSSMSTSKTPSSAAFFEPNTFGVLALNKGIGEWGMRDLSAIPDDKLQENLFIVMGMLDNDSGKDLLPPVISRFPWEGFEEIGFRTVMELSIENDK